MCVLSKSMVMNIMSVIVCYAEMYVSCQHVCVAQRIRRPPTKRETAGSSPVADFYLLVIF
jgi:hypothetical protein